MRDSPVQSLERGLRILEIIGRCPTPLTLTELAEKAALSMTTANRFVRTLHTLGYLVREQKRYSVGPKVLSLGCQFLNSSELIKMAKPLLDELASQLNRTVNLGVLDGSDMVFLYRNERRRFLKFDVHPGSRVPAYCSAMGKLLLAYLDEKQMKATVDHLDLQRVTSRTITSKERLLRQLRKIRVTDYAVSDQEISMDLYSIAVPLLNDKGTVVAGINVSLEIRDRTEQTVKRVVRELAKKGDLISHLLGYRGRYRVTYMQGDGL